MARIPDQTALGAPETPVSARPVQGYDASVIGQAEEGAAANVATGFREAQSGVESFADNVRAANDAVSAASAGSQILQGKLALDKERQDGLSNNNPDDPWKDPKNWTGLYADKLTAIKTGAVAPIQSPEMKARTAIAIDNTIADSVSRIQDAAYTKNLQSIDAWDIANRESLTRSAESAPTDNDALKGLYSAGVAGIDATVQKGAISAAEGERRKIEFAQSLGQRTLLAMPPFQRADAMGLPIVRGGGNLVPPDWQPGTYLNAPVESDQPMSNPDRNNPGNLRVSAANQWQGKTTQPGADFESFDTVENGIRARALTYATYLRTGSNTIQQIAERSGPASDNNDIPSQVAAYKQALGGRYAQPGGENLPLQQTPEILRRLTAGGISIEAGGGGNFLPQGINVPLIDKTLQDIGKEKGAPDLGVNPSASLAQFATDNAVPGGPSSVAGVVPGFASRILAMTDAMPPDIRAKFSITSGFRDQNREDQVNPGVTNSHHSQGMAVDTTTDPDVLSWINQNGDKFGVGYTLNSDPAEANHLEPTEGGKRIAPSDMVAWAASHGGVPGAQGGSFATGLLTAQQREAMDRKTEFDVNREAIDIGADYTRQIIDGESGNGPMPDRAAIANDPRLDPKVSNSILERYDAAAKKMNVGERLTVTNMVNDDLASMLNTGQGRQDIDNSRVTAALGPERAAEWLDKRQTASEAFSAASDLPTMSIGDIAQRVTSLKPQPGAVDFARKQAVYDHVLGAVTKLQEQRKTDPALSVMGNPSVAPAMAALQQSPDDPTTVQKAAQATLGEQARIGIPPESQHILTNAQAGAQVKNIQALMSDPTKDVGGALDAMATKYGDQWPKVFGDLVQQKLPAYIQVLANLDTPGQQAARADLQQAFAVAQQKGGLGKLEEAVPEADQKIIKTDLDTDPRMTAFRDTFEPTSQSAIAFDQMKDATRSLAYFRAGLMGVNSSNAVPSASADVTGRYDIDGTIRAPKGTMSDVKTAADLMQTALKPEDVMPLPVSLPGLKQDDLDKQGRQLVMDAKKKWYANDDDSGLILKGIARDGSFFTVRHADGSPVEFKFSDVPGIVAGRPTYAAPPILGLTQGGG